jgi:hypothetical protein
VEKKESIFEKVVEMNCLLEHLKRLAKWFSNGQGGFTALQTAIVMVSSVVTAGSVATVVVSSGTEAADEAQQAITETVQNLSGTFMIKGDVVGKASITGAHGTLGQIIFNVGLVLNDGAMDFTPPTADPNNNGIAGPDSRNVIILSFIDANQRVDDLYWTAAGLGKNNGDYLLEGGELFQITVGSPAPGQNGGNLIDALNPDLSTYTNFTLEMLHAQSPAYSIEQRTPGTISKVVTMH